MGLTPIANRRLAHSACDKRQRGWPLSSVVSYVKPSSVVAIPPLVTQLYKIVAELERLFPGRRFTPDGHLVGSIGEVLAAHRYGLTLLPGSTEVHDAQAPNGVRVQVKATQGKSVALRAEPRHLLVLLLAPNGEVTEVFNGPGSVAWAACGPMQQNGQRSIGVSKLRTLMAAVPPTARLVVTCGQVISPRDLRKEPHR